MSIKNIRQNIRENIKQCWFYETSNKILRVISKAPPSPFVFCRQNINVDSVKQILYYTIIIKTYDSLNERYYKMYYKILPSIGMHMMRKHGF